MSKHHDSFEWNRDRRSAAGLLVIAFILVLATVAGALSRGCVG